jgi:3-hydroxybutyryl-CoA dehydratase|tara:strand:- start:594 stop:1019 length:426 start_codon:yes stop_codon:yes gene_type:complete
MINPLNELSYDDISIGQQESFIIKITESMVEKFSNLSGDLNPLHMDNEFAESSSFNKRIVHGMLLASFFSQLIGMKLPGKNALYFSQTLNFRSPCYIDDEIEVIGEVTEKSDSTQIITVSTTIFNKSKTCLIDGIAKIIVK